MRPSLQIKMPEKTKPSHRCCNLLSSHHIHTTDPLRLTEADKIPRRCRTPSRHPRDGHSPERPARRRRHGPNRVGSLEEGQAAGRFAQRMKMLTWPAVLVIDEVGDVRMRHPIGL